MAAKYRQPEYNIHRHGSLWSGLLCEWEVRNDVGDTVLLIRDRELIEPIRAMLKELNGKGGPTRHESTRAKEAGTKPSRLDKDTS